MFLPTSNRLASFLEISALSIALAQSGGAQYKAGFLRVEAVSKRVGSFISSFLTSSREEDKEGRGPNPFGRKSVGFRDRREQRWCAVRESYIVALVEPGELEVWDVFLLDSDFKIERPKRYYRQGLGTFKLGHESSDDEQDDVHSAPKTTSPSLHPHFEVGALDHHKEHGIQIKVTDDDSRSCKSAVSSIKSRVSKIFHRNGHAESTKSSKKTSSIGSRKRSLIGLGIKRGSGGSEKGEMMQDEATRRTEDMLNSKDRRMASGTTEMTHTPRPSMDSDISTPLSRRSGSITRSGGSEDGHTREPSCPAEKATTRSNSIDTLEGAQTPMMDPSVQLDGMLKTDGLENRKKVSKMGPASGAQAGPSSPQSDVPLDVDHGVRELSEEERRQKEREAVDQAVRSERAKKADSKDVSKHTFYVINSQMRLKLYARNEVSLLEPNASFVH
jgi:hypothetical protein